MDTVSLVLPSRLAVGGDAFRQWRCGLGMSHVAGPTKHLLSLALIGRSAPEPGVLGKFMVLRSGPCARDEGPCMAGNSPVCASLSFLGRARADRCERLRGAHAVAQPEPNEIVYVDRLDVLLVGSS